MKVLLIGGGGREHALAWKLAQSPRLTHLWCAPGNAGMAAERLGGSGKAVECVPLSSEDLPGLLDFARHQGADLTVVGPDNPLGMGIVDLFQKAGLRIWGPNRQAAQFEASKAFSQSFMDRHGIPTARSGVFTAMGEASRFASSLGGRCAVKADGLALGKGVLICRDMAQADDAIDQMLNQGAFGEAGRQIVIQELLEGIEVSLHALCDGRTARLFPTSQDHKRALDDDRGPNTGGMGTYSPAPFLNQAELIAVSRRIIDPWLAGCAADGIDFRGMLYPGIMLTREGPKVLEFNARFGDPETQVYLPRLKSDLLDLLEASAEGRLTDTPLEWSSRACVCVVLASGGYPGKYARGAAIHGLDEADGLPDVKVFHAGTAIAGGKVVTSGGRVLGVTAWADDLQGARDRAYAAVERIRFEGMQYRRDIAARGLRV